MTSKPPGRPNYAALAGCLVFLVAAAVPLYWPGGRRHEHWLERQRADRATTGHRSSVDALSDEDPPDFWIGRILAVSYVVMAALLARDAFTGRSVEEASAGGEGLPVVRLSHVPPPPEPPRLGDDPFRDPPRRPPIVVVRAPPPPPPPIVPGDPGDAPKQLT